MSVKLASSREFFDEVIGIFQKFFYGIAGSIWALLANGTLNAIVKILRIVNVWRSSRDENEEIAKG